MRSVQTLICEAIDVCGGQGELARRVGLHRPEISDLASGKRPISPAMVGLLCDVLNIEGAEAQRLAAEAIILTAKAEKRGVLRRAFFARSTTGAMLEATAASGGAVVKTVVRKRVIDKKKYTLSRIGLSDQASRADHAPVRVQPVTRTLALGRSSARPAFQNHQTVPRLAGNSFH